MIRISSFDKYEEEIRIKFQRFLMKQRLKCWIFQIF